jgi:hypothetical protein
LHAHGSLASSAKPTVEQALERLPSKARQSVEQMFRSLDEQGSEKMMPNTSPTKWSVFQQ